jgi:hypothetical protein
LCLLHLDFLNLFFLHLSLLGGGLMLMIIEVEVVDTGGVAILQLTHEGGHLLLHRTTIK